MTERKRKGSPDEVFNVFGDGHTQTALWSMFDNAAVLRELNNLSRRRAEHCVTHRIRVFLKRKETTDDPAR